MSLYKIHTIANKRDISMYMPFYVEAKGIQSACGKAFQYIKENKYKHKLEIIKIEKIKGE